MNRREHEHRLCISITRNDAGEFVSCNTCGTDDGALGETRAWNKFDNATQFTEPNTSKFNDGDALFESEHGPRGFLHRKQYFAETATSLPPVPPGEDLDD